MAGEENTFARFDPYAAAPPATPDADPDNTFAKFDPFPGGKITGLDHSFEESQTSTLGSFARGFERSVVPTGASLAGAGAGAEFGAGVGGVIAGPFGAGVGGFLGAVGGGIYAGYLGNKAQDWALSKAPDTARAIGLSPEQRELDEKNHPYASFMGGMAPFVLTMSPTAPWRAAANLPENPTALDKVLANPWAKAAFGGAVMGGLELGQEAIAGEDLDWRKGAIATGFGIVFNRPNVIGQRLEALGGAPIRAFRPEPPPAPPMRPWRTPEVTDLGPTVAMAGDYGVMGAGITEQSFLGQQQRSPESVAATTKARQEEISVLGDDRPVTPQVDTEARRLEPDLFKEYDALRAQEAEIRAWIEEETNPPGEAEIAAARARVDDLTRELHENSGSWGENRLRRQWSRIATAEQEATALEERARASAEGRTVEGTTPAQVAAAHLNDTVMAMRRLGPQLTEAYRRAADSVGAEVVDTHGEPVAEPTQEPARAAPAEAAGEAPAPPGAAATLPAPPRPIAEQKAFIAQDVTRQLMAAGRPREQAELEGQLYAERLATRAQRMAGALGTPEDLYRREGARIAASEALDDGGVMLRQDQQPAPPFYSAVERAVGDAAQEKAAPAQWLGMLKNRPGVKPEELEWLGLEDWLKGQGRSVSKADVLNYIRANRIEVRDVSKLPALTAEQRARLNDLDERLDSLTVEEASERGSLMHAESREARGGPRWDKMALPGGENYGELLLTLPAEDKVPDLVRYLQSFGSVVLDRTRTPEDVANARRFNSHFRETTKGLTPEEVIAAAREAERAPPPPAPFQSSHWQEPNVLAHVRFDDRTIDGKKTLFINELQSDWHQQGRHSGYRVDATEEQLRADLKRLTETLHASQRAMADAQSEAMSRESGGAARTVRELRNLLSPDAFQAALVRVEADPEVVRARQAYYDATAEQGTAQVRLNNRDRGVPNAPFKTTWPELTLKRMIRWAAENGYDRVAWPKTAEQVAQIEDWGPIRREGDKWLIHGDHNVTPIVERYLTDLPRLANKLVKKFGTKVETWRQQLGGRSMSDIDRDIDAIWQEIERREPGTDFTNYDQSQPAWGRHPDLRDARHRLMDERAEAMDRRDVHGVFEANTLPITESLKDAAISEGFPLFQQERGAVNLNPTRVRGRSFLGVPDVNPIIRLTEHQDASTVSHEFGHVFLAELMRDAAHEAAPDQLKADAKTTLDWLGADGPRGITRRHHEKFARGFEQYMREGTAPSPGLGRVFAQFRDWLVKIYTTLRGLGREIPPEMRDVFDRLLAVDVQRTVIAPERPVETGIARDHELDAAGVDDQHADAAGDRAEAEHTASFTRHDRAPEIDTATGRTAPQPGAEAGGRAGAGGEVPAGARPPEPESGGGGGGAPLPEVGAGDREAAPESPGVAGRGAAPGGVPESAGAARPGLSDQPLATSSADVLDHGATHNLGKNNNVRAENISSVEEMQRAIDDASDRIPGTDDVFTDGQLTDFRDFLGMSPGEITRDTLARAFGGVKDLNKKVFAFRTMVRAQAQTVTNLSAQVREAADGSPEQVTAALAYGRERARLDMFMGVLSSVSTEWGRAGRAFRNLEAFDRIRDQADAERVTREQTGLELNQLITEAKLGTRFDTPAKLLKWMRTAQKRSFGGMLLEYFVNNLISGPLTHTTYVVGRELLNQYVTLAETPFAAAIGMTREALGRQGERVYLNEVMARERAFLTGLPARIQAATEAARTGRAPLLPGEAPEARPQRPLQGDTAADIYGEYWLRRSFTNQPVTLREALDDLYSAIRGGKDAIVGAQALIEAGAARGARPLGWHFSIGQQIPDIAVRGVPVIPLGSLIRLPSRGVTMLHAQGIIDGYRTSIEQQATRQANVEGLQGSARAQRVADLRQNPTEDMMDRARDEAYQTMLMSPGGSFMRKLQILVNHTVKFPVLGETQPFKFIDPFVTIGGNIVRGTIERTPLALIDSRIRDDLMGRNGNVAADMALARMLAGSSLILAYMGLAQAGYITGSGPRDPNQNRAWREVYQPHSVRIGDMWYQVNRLGPMGMHLGIAADLYEVSHLISRGDAGQAAAYLWHSVAQNIIDESFLKGPADLIKAAEEPDRFGERWLANYVGDFVPFSVGMYQMNRAADPYTREARTVMDAIMARIPGQSQTLEPRISAWGEPVPSPQGLGGITSIWERPVNVDPVKQAILDAGYAPAPVQRKIRNVDLEPHEHTDYATASGTLAHRLLTPIVTSENWERMPAGVRHDVVRRVIESTRETARGQMMARYPHIATDAVNAMRERRITGGEPIE